MIEMMPAITTPWVVFMINYFVHSTLLIGLVLLACHGKWLAYDRLGEWVMKSTLLLGFFSALLQTNGWLPSFASATSPWKINVYAEPAMTTSGQSPLALVETNPTAVRDSNSNRVSAPPSLPKQRNQPSDSDAEVLKAEAAVTALKARSTVTGSQFSWIAVGMLLWLGGALWLMTGHFINRRKWRQLMSCRQVVTDPRTLKSFNQLLYRSGIAGNIKLSQSANITSPVAMHREVVCPVQFLQCNEIDKIEAALAHELAHIKRRDASWLMVSRWLQVLTFFQPLNRVLMQAIHQATEQRADTLAAQWTDNPRALAVTLVDVATADNSQPHIQMVPAMTSQTNKLLLRVENILQQNPLTSNRWSISLLFGIMLLVMIAGPGVVAQTKSVQFASDSSQYNIQTGNGATDMSLSFSQDDRQLKLKAKLKGKIEFNEDESAIVSFPPNSRFDLTHTEAGVKQRILIKSEPSINTENAAYTYWVDGDEQSFDDQARRWLAKVLPMVWRQTGIQAEARVKRIQQQHGDGGVLEEVALIDSDFVRKAYLTHLFNLSQLNDSDLNRALQLAAEIGSDFELSHVLTELVETQNLTSEQDWLAYFSATDSIDSDFEMAKTMLNVLPQLPTSEAVNQAYFKAAKSIGSDFEMSKVLMAYLKQKSGETVNVMNLFNLAADIGSDFELAKVMMAANQYLDHANNTDDVITAYLDLAAHIDSDFEMKKVYADLLSYPLTEKHLTRMISAATEHIGSDFELASLLLSITKQQNLNEAVKVQIKSAAQSIGSQFERNRVLAAFG